MLSLFGGMTRRKKRTTSKSRKGSKRKDNF